MRWIGRAIRRTLPRTGACHRAGLCRNAGNRARKPALYFFPCQSWRSTFLVLNTLVLTSLFAQNRPLIGWARKLRRPTVTAGRGKDTKNNVHSVCLQVKFLEAASLCYVVERDVGWRLRHALAKNASNPKNIFPDLRFTNSSKAHPNFSIIHRPQTPAPTQHGIGVTHLFQIDDRT